MHRKFSLSALFGLMVGAALITLAAIFLSPLQSVFASGSLPGGSSILAIPAKGGLLGSPTIIPPKIVVTSGNASVLGCTATDSNSNPVAISCTPKSALGSVFLEDVTFTANQVNSATPLNTYTITYDLDGHPDLTQSIYVGYLPASVTVVASSPSSNFVWNDSDLYATSAGQAVSVLSSDVRSHLNTGNTLVAASGAIAVNSGFTSTTSGNGVTFKGLTYLQANTVPITTANGPVTIWSTNPNTPTGSSGVTGVYLGISAYITTTGGDITIGGGSDPYNFPVTAELGVSVDRSGRIWAGGGNISIRGDSVLNASLNTADHQMKGVLITTPTISTTGSGTITIEANATGSANGRIADALYLDNGGSITSVDGAISVTAGNLGSGKTNGIYSPTATSIAATGTGSINLTGDVRGTSTASSQAPAALSVYGLYFGNDSNVTTVDGNLSVRGYGGNFAASTALANIHSYGIYASASKLLSTGSGTVNVYGLGGNIGNTVAAKAAFSIGIYNASWLGTTTANLTVEGVSGSVSGVAGTEYGYWSEVNTSAAANKNSASMISTTGSVTLIGDTAPNGATATGITVYGIYTSGAKVKSTSGNVSITGTVCSTCTTPEISTAAYGVLIKNNSTVPTWNEFLTGGSGTFTIVGHADNELNTTPTSYGINASFDSATRASLSTQTGALSLTGTATGTSAYGVYLGSNTPGSGLGSTTDGQFSISGTATGNSTYGIFSNNYAFSTGSGGFNFSGSATSTSGAANGVSLSNSSATATSGATTINGTANSTGSAVGISPTTFGFASGAGSISLTGNATVNNNTAGGSAYGVAFNGASTTTTSGNVTILGNTYNAVNVYNNYGVRILTHPITTGAGAISLTGYANGATTSAGSVAYGLYSGSALKTTTGAITLYGEVPNLTTSQAVGTTLTASATSGDSATATTGGQVSITGKTGMVTTNSQQQILITGGNIDTFNNSIEIVAGAPSAVANSQRAGLTLSGTETWAATASSLTVTAHGELGSKSLYQDASNVLNLGGTTSHANITFNVHQWNKTQIAPFAITNIDTDGSVSILPIGTSFGPDMFNVSGNAVMATNFVPTTRVTAFTIGKPGNTRDLTLNVSTSNTSPFNINPTSGVLKIFAGTVTANYRVSAGTLAIDSSGSVTMGTSTNAFTSVAVKRSAATGWNLANSASSWTAGTYGGVTGVYGVPAKLKASGTPPSTAALGSNMAAYSVIANDAYDLPIAAANIRGSDALSVTASAKTGATTTLGGTTTRTGTAGSAIAFNDLSFSSPGIHTIAFDATNFTQYVSPSITVSGGTPTLALSYFSDSNTTEFATSTTTASPTFTSNNTSSASYTSTTTAVCTVVSSTGVITTKTPGTCTIRVDQAADANYVAGTQTINITINKKSQVALSVTSTSGNYGSALSLATSGGNAGAVTYFVDSGTCTLATSTTLNLGLVGSACAIIATRAGDATYAAVSSASTTITVNKGNQATLVTPATTNLTYLSAGLDLSTLTFSGGSGTGSINFSTAAPGCSITGTTLTSTNSVGVNCVITATKDGDANYNIGTGANFTVTLVKATQSELSVTSTSATFGLGLNLTYSGGSGTGQITFSVVSGSCTISSTTLTPTAATTCVIKVTKALDTNYNVASSADTTVTIAKGTQAALTINSTSGSYASVLSLSTAGGTDAGAVTFVVDSGTCSLATATTLNLGVVGDSCMVTATKAATGNYNSAVSASTSIATIRANQATLGVPAGVTLNYANGAGLDLASLTFTGGSGTGSISFSTSTAGCSIASNILRSTNNAATTCVVASSKAGDSNYNSGSAVNFTVSISKATQSPLVAPATAFLTYGDSAGLDLTTLSFTGGSGTGMLTFSTNTSGCSISNNILTSTNNATMGCIVASSKGSDTNYNIGSAVNLTVTIVTAAQAPITITSTSGTYGQALALAATGGSGGGAFTFDVVSGTCSISGVSLTLGDVGSSCLITATRGGSQNYQPGTSASTSIASLPGAQAPLVITSTSGSNGQTLSLAVSGGNGSGAVSFVVDSGTCSVSGSTLTLGNAGSSCMVTATKAASTNYSAKSSLSTSISTAKSNQVSLSVTSLAVTFGANLTLTSSGGSSNGAVTYSKVSGPCTISSGVLNPTGAGNCVVTASMAGGTNYNDVSSVNTTVVIAKANQASLNWNLSSTSVAYLGTLALAATGGSGTGAVVFSVSGSSTCTISGTTLVPSDAGTTCEITATKVADSNYNSADTATQTITVTKIAQASLSFSNSTTLIYGQTMDLLAVGGSGGGTITYAVSNAGTTGCSLSADRLSVTGAGTCVVTAVRASSTNYSSSGTASLSITVSKAGQTVSFTSTVPAEPIAGDTYSVSASTSSGTTPTISVSSGPCTISNNVVTLTSAGNCVISASASSTNQYLAAASVTQTVAIGQRNQNLSFTSTVRAMSVKTYGDPAFFAEATTSEPTLTPVYSRGSATTNTACSISTSGIVVILAVGTCEIEVNQPGDAAVAAASAIKKSIQVVPDVANAPFITSVSAGHESITAAFIAPTYIGGSAISGYQIVAVSGSTVITNSACSLAGSGNIESCSVNSLTNGTNYRIKVAAITAAGIGLYSDLSAARMPATNPAAVSAFTAVPDNTSLVLSWSDPVSLGGGTFDSYRVFYKLLSSANYPSTYINILSQTPRGYTITGLVNGESYDVRIVTVTTANTAALVSNTAEVKETPRTVPEAPATVEVLEVAGQLVITWSTPQSDGGNAITEYRVTINGTTCTLANALDNLCSIAIPTNGGTYPIEVIARNGAGYGSAATATFTKAGVSSSGGSGGGSESSSNGHSSIQVLALSVKSLPNVGGQVVSITGKNLGAVTTILIDGIKAKIISVADGVIKFTAPRNTDGPATLTLKSPTASAEVVDAFTYAQGIAKVKVAWVLGFVQANTTIKAADKAKLRSGLLKSTGTVAVTCVGYQSYSYNTAKDAQTAMGRAKRACDYLKSVNPKLSVKTVIARTTLTGTPSRKLAIQFKTSN